MSSSRLVVLPLGLAAAWLSGCLGDCTVTEATGLLSPFGGGCSASGDFDDRGGALEVSIGLFGAHDAENLYETIEFSGRPPFYVGKHETSRVLVTQRGAIFLDRDPLPAEGQVDFIIDGADFSKSYSQHMFITIVKLEVRDLVTSKLGTFRGSVSLLKTGN